MRILFVQTYPVYHDLLSTEAWLAVENRDKWMPGILAAEGHEVALWAVAEEAGVYPCHLRGMAGFSIRLFTPTHRGRHTKFDYSDALVEAAQEAEADVFVLKGTDGGVGVRLLEQYLLPARRPFVFVIGGKFYTPHVPKAKVVFYETEFQRQILAHPGWRFWRKPVPAHRLIRLPKSVDTEHFRPMPEVEKRYDVIAVGRLIARYKRYEALGKLSQVLRVAVVGGGPAAEELARRYPAVEWLGPKPHAEIPFYLNQARVFMYSGLRDYYPRVIPEAMACGLPVVAFREAIKPDVVPPTCGFLVSRRRYVEDVVSLVRDEKRCTEMGRRARMVAEERLHRYSSREAMHEMLQRLRYS